MQVEKLPNFSGVIGVISFPMGIIMKVKMIEGKKLKPEIRSL